jgi:hypothetical protein
MNLNGNGNFCQTPPPDTPGGVPDLIIPQVSWKKGDYASLQGRLDLYTDFVILSKFKEGKVTEQYPVDPVELAAAIGGVNLSSGLLPPNCLFWSKLNGLDRLGVYLPPQMRYLTVRGEALAWRVPLPGLIMVGHDYDYSLWAVVEEPNSGGHPPLSGALPQHLPSGSVSGQRALPPGGHCDYAPGS